MWDDVKAPKLIIDISMIRGRYGAAVGPHKAMKVQKNANNLLN